MEQFSRTAALIGVDAVEALQGKRVAVFGIGGVGGYVVEALARSGVGALDLIDADRVSVSNINRQIIALHSTVGQYKTDVAAARVKDISPTCNVQCYNVFYAPDCTLFDFSAYDYVVDAVDNVAAKIALVENCVRANTPIIASMGAGNKLDATRFEVADLSKTSVCPLARVMRRELKKRGIEHVKVVYSKEEPLPSAIDEHGKPAPASIAFVPSVVGLIIAGEVIKDLVKNA